MRNNQAIFLLFGLGILTFVALVADRQRIPIQQTTIDGALTLPLHPTRIHQSRFNGNVRNADSQPIWTNEIGRFSREETDSEWILTYEWQDYINETRQVQFSISKDELQRSKQSFGISPQQRAAYYAEHIDFQNSEVQAIYKALKLKQGPVHLENYKVVPRSEYSAFQNYAASMEQDFLANQGFKGVSGNFEVDYATLCQTQKDVVRNITRAVLQTAIEAEMDWNMAVHLFASLIHMIEYEIPPIVEEGRITNGLWTPLDAYQRGKADCDTKAVMAASSLLWLRDLESTIDPALIVVPGHAFNGLVGWSKRLPMDVTINDRGVEVLLIDLTDSNNYWNAGAIHESDKEQLRQARPLIYRFERNES